MKFKEGQKVIVTNVDGTPSVAENFAEVWRDIFGCEPPRTYGTITRIDEGDRCCYGVEFGDDTRRRYLAEEEIRAFGNILNA